MADETSAEKIGALAVDVLADVTPVETGVASVRELLGQLVQEQYTVHLRLSELTQAKTAITEIREALGAVRDEAAKEPTARKGRALKFEVDTAKIRADIEGALRDPFKIRIEIENLTEVQQVLGEHTVRVQGVMAGGGAAATSAAAPLTSEGLVDALHQAARREAPAPVRRILEGNPDLRRFTHELYDTLSSALQRAGHAGLGEDTDDVAEKLGRIFDRFGTDLSGIAKVNQAGLVTGGALAPKNLQAMGVPKGDSGIISALGADFVRQASIARSDNQGLMDEVRQGFEAWRVAAPAQQPQSQVAAATNATARAADKVATQGPLAAFNQREPVATSRAREEANAAMDAVIQRGRPPGVGPGPLEGGARAFNLGEAVRATLAMQTEPQFRERPDVELPQFARPGLVGPSARNVAESPATYAGTAIGDFGAQPGSRYESLRQMLGRIPTNAGPAYRQAADEVLREMEGETDVTRDRMLQEIRRRTRRIRRRGPLQPLETNLPVTLRAEGAVPGGLHKMAGTGVFGGPRGQATAEDLAAQAAQGGATSGLVGALPSHQGVDLTPLMNLASSTGGLFDRFGRIVGSQGMEGIVELSDEAIERFRNKFRVPIKFGEGEGPIIKGKPLTVGPHRVERITGMEMFQLLARELYGDAGAEAVEQPGVKQNVSAMLQAGRRTARIGISNPAVGSYGPEFGSGRGGFKESTIEAAKAELDWVRGLDPAYQRREALMVGEGEEAARRGEQEAMARRRTAAEAFVRQGRENQERVAKDEYTEAYGESRGPMQSSGLTAAEALQVNRQIEGIASDRLPRPSVIARMIGDRVAAASETTRAPFKTGPDDPGEMRFTGRFSAGRAIVSAWRQAVDEIASATGLDLSGRNARAIDAKLKQAGMDYVSVIRDSMLREASTRDEFATQTVNRMRQPGAGDRMGTELEVGGKKILMPTSPMTPAQLRNQDLRALAMELSALDRPTESGARVPFASAVKPSTAQPLGFPTEPIVFDASSRIRTTARDRNRGRLLRQQSGAPFPSLAIDKTPSTFEPRPFDIQPYIAGLREQAQAELETTRKALAFVKEITGVGFQEIPPEKVGKFGTVRGVPRVVRGGREIHEEPHRYNPLFQLEAFNPADLKADRPEIMAALPTAGLEPEVEAEVRAMFKNRTLRGLLAPVRRKIVGKEASGADMRERYAEDFGAGLVGSGLRIDERTGEVLEGPAEPPLAAFNRRYESGEPMAATGGGGGASMGGGTTGAPPPSTPGGRTGATPWGGGPIDVRILSPIPLPVWVRGGIHVGGTGDAGGVVTGKRRRGVAATAAVADEATPIYPASSLRERERAIRGTATLPRPLVFDPTREYRNLPVTGALRIIGTRGMAESVAAGQRRAYDTLPEEGAFGPPVPRGIRAEARALARQRAAEDMRRARELEGAPGPLEPPTMRAERIARERRESRAARAAAATAATAAAATARVPAMTEAELEALGLGDDSAPFPARLMARPDERVTMARARAQTARGTLQGRALGPAIISTLQNLVGIREAPLQRIAELTDAESDLNRLTQIWDEFQGRRDRTGVRLAAAQTRLAADPGNTRLALAVTDLTGKFTKLDRAVIQVNTAVGNAADRVNELSDSAVQGSDILKNLGVGVVGGVIGGAVGGLTAMVATQLTSVVLQGLGAAFGPSVERMLGFSATTNRVTSALSDATRAADGNVRAVIAQTAAQSGMSKANYDSISATLQNRVAIEAGNKALMQQVDLYRTTDNLRRSGGDPIDAFRQLISGGTGGTPGLTRATGGFLGTQLGATPSTIEIISGALPRAAADPVGDFLGSIFDPGGVQRRLDDAAKALEKFNNQAQKGGSALQFVAAASVDQVEATQRLLEAAGVGGVQRGQFRNLGIALQGPGGQVPTDEESVNQFLQAVGVGSLRPDAQVLISGMQKQIQAMFARASEESRLARQGNAITTAVSLAASPIAPLGRGLTSQFAPGFVNQAISDSGGAFASAVVRLQERAEAGRQALASWQVPSGVLDDVTAIGLEIDAVVGRMAQRKADAFWQDYNHNVEIAQRNIGDLLGLTGRASVQTATGTVTSTGIGRLEGRNLQLGRESQRIQFDLSQNELNLQTAIAGFAAPGDTPEERAARLQYAQKRARVQQRQLDINREIFGNQNQIVDEQNIRALNEAVYNLNRMDRDVRITVAEQVDTATIEHLTKIREALIADAQTIIGEGRTIQGAMLDVASQVQAASDEFWSVVIDDVKAGFKEASAAARESLGLPPETPTGNQDQTASGFTWDRDQGEPGGPGELTPMVTQGQSVTVNINGGTFSSEQEQERLVQRIVAATEASLNRKASLYGQRAPR